MRHDFAPPLNRRRFLTWRGLRAGIAGVLFLIAFMAAELVAAEAVVGFLTDTTYIEVASHADR